MSEDIILPNKPVVFVDKTWRKPRKGATKKTNTQNVFQVQEFGTGNYNKFSVKPLNSAAAARTGKDACTTASDNVKEPAPKPAERPKRRERRAQQAATNTADSDATATPAATEKPRRNPQPFHAFQTSFPLTHRPVKTTTTKKASPQQLKRNPTDNASRNANIASQFGQIINDSNANALWTFDGDMDMTLDPIDGLPIFDDPTVLDFGAAMRTSPSSSDDSWHFNNVNGDDWALLDNDTGAMVRQTSERDRNDTFSLLESLPINWAMGASGAGVPIEMSATYWKIAQYYQNVVAQMVYPNEDKLTYNPLRTTLLSLAMQDEVFLYTILYSAALRMVACGILETKEQSMLFHFVIEGLKKRLVSQGKDSTSESTIGAVACLAVVQVMEGNIGAWRMHIQGLKNMVQGRGGMSTIVETLETKVYRSDLEGAIEFLRPPVMLRPSRLQFKYLNPKHPTRPTYFTNVVGQPQSPSAYTLNPTNPAHPNYSLDNCAPSPLSNPFSTSLSSLSLSTYQLRSLLRTSTPVLRILSDLSSFASDFAVAFDTSSLPGASNKMHPYEFDRRLGVIQHDILDRVCGESAATVTAEAAMAERQRERERALAAAIESSSSDSVTSDETVERPMDDILLMASLICTRILQRGSASNPGNSPALTQRIRDKLSVCSIALEGETSESNSFSCASDMTNSQISQTSYPMLPPWLTMWICFMGYAASENDVLRMWFVRTLSSALERSRVAYGDDTTLEMWGQWCEERCPRVPFLGGWWAEFVARVEAEGEDNI